MSNRHIHMAISTGLLLIVLALTSCGGTLLDASEREVVTQDAQLLWQPGTSADVPGFWLSESVSGDAAGALLMITYYFTDEGTFTGAALAFGEDGQPAFQALSGSWTCSEGTLQLEPAGETVRLERAPGHLRLETPSGSVILRREALR